jgi:hypothetical protein
MHDTYGEFDDEKNNEKSTSRDKNEERDWSRTKLEADWSWPQPQQLIFSHCMSFVAKQNTKRKR